MIFLPDVVQRFSLNFSGNVQFLFLRKPPETGASGVCITFPKINQKILTKGKIHWLGIINEILSFLQIYGVRKTTTQLF